MAVGFALLALEAFVGHVLATEGALEAVRVVSCFAGCYSFAGDDRAVATCTKQVHTLIVVCLTIGVS